MKIPYPPTKTARKNGGRYRRSIHERPSRSLSINNNLPHRTEKNSREIPEIKLAEKALQIEKNKLKSVIDAMSDGLTILTRDFDIIFQNEPARASGGGDHVGEKCYRIYEKSDKVCEGCPVKLAFQDGKTHTSERKRTLPSGELSFWGNTANPVKDVNGKVIICLEIGHDVTGHKRAEKALQESQKFASSLLENAPHATMVINPDTSVRYVNPAWEHLNGWTAAEAVGLKAPYPWWPEEYKEEFLPRFMEAIHQPIGRGEIIALKKNGEAYWIDMNWVSVTHDGEFQYVIINSVDITERKKAEEKRQAILKTALDGFWICDLEGRFLEVNDSYCTMIGYTQEELLKMSIKDIEAIERHEQTSRRIKKIIEQGGDRFETKHKRKDGRIIDIEISAKYPDTKEGQIFVFVRDITERKKDQKALRESEEKFSKVFHVSPVMIAITAIKDGKYIEVNDSYALSTGYSREELLGKTATDMHIWAHADDRAKMHKILEEQGRVHNLEINFRMKSGEIRTWLFSAEPITISGEPCIIGVSFDITERKLMEEALANEATRRRILIEQSRDGIVILDQNGAVYEANRRFAEMLGYSPEEILKLRVWDWEFLYPPEQVREMISTVDEAGDHFQTRHRRKDGTTFDVEISTNGAMFAGQKLIFCVCRDITERKTMEAKRQAILQTALDGFWICDLGGKFLEVNDSYCTMTGYTREELLKMSIKDIEAIERPEETAQRIKKVIEQGGDRFETKHRSKDGRIIDMEISVKYHNIGEGQLTVFVRNITERKKAEEQLRLLSSVTQQVSDSIMITDPKMKVTYMNKAAQDLFGYTLDEIRGKDLSAFHLTQPTEKIKREVRECINQGKVWNETITKTRKDGRLIICDCRLSPLYDENGQISSYIDVERDVTERKEVEAKLQAQKQLIESILATMPEGVLVIDGNDRVILANESAHRIFSRRTNTIKNKLLKDIIPADQLLNLYNYIKLGKKEGDTLEFRYRVHNIDKIVLCCAIKMDEGRTLLTFTDVSHEREEKEKLYLTDRLASLGEMAVGLAHELNNPLTGIISLSQLLIDSDIPPEPKEDLQCIYSEAKRAANIVKNVLLFTRNNNYENGQASVNEVVRDVLRLREYEEKTNNIKIITDLQEDLPDVVIDKFQLQQVFLNIIINAEAAIKDANRPGLLTVITEKVNHHVNVTFGDNGCGIKKNVLPRIFDPFFTTKDIGKGTGLGLSICYGIVSQHGGKISVKTQVNKGTAFTVRMPAVTK